MRSVQTSLALLRHVESPLEGRPCSLLGLHRGQSRGCREDVVLDIIKYEPVKVGSNLYERTAKRFPVYVENICVRNIRLEAVGNKMKLAQGESNRILLAVPRETWFTLSGNVIEALGSQTCQGR